jgi:glutaredoxin
MTSHKVKLFALSTCSHCKAAKKLLDRYEHEVDVVEVDRLDRDDRDTAIKAVKQYNERVSFPTTVIGDKVIVGYKADQIKKALQQD